MTGRISFVILPLVVLAGYQPFDSQSTYNDAAAADARSGHTAAWRFGAYFHVDWDQKGNSNEQEH